MHRRLPEDKSDQRWSARKTSAMAGTLSSVQLPGPVACVVRDLSSTGALIELRDAKSAASSLPDTFTLFLTCDNSEVSCQLVWRQPTRIGVRFIGVFKTRPVRRKAKPAPAKRKWF